MAKSRNRKQAILRGLEFIYRSACDSENFVDYGFDYLFCLYWIASTSQDQSLRFLARQMGKERSLCWRREHSKLPAELDADAITHLVFGSYISDRFGVRDGGLKREIVNCAGSFNTRDYFWFDAAIESPPCDVPEDCACGAVNARGTTTCRDCNRTLSMMSPYEVWVVALIRSYLGERFGVVLGARYSDVIKWLPAMRPYVGPAAGFTPAFVWSIYSITHLVYTLNDYGRYSLSPQWLPHEYTFLTNNLDNVIAMEDPETVGEVLDCLKSFGLSDRCALMRRGVEYLLSQQNSDGSWGDMHSDDAYERYHPTVTAINGLRDYSWSGKRLSFPRLLRKLECWAMPEV